MLRSLIILCFTILCWTCRPTEPTVPPLTQRGFNQDNKDRAVWQKPSSVVNLLGDIEGKTVADIGAGTGYFAFRFAYKNAYVIAIEIDQDMIDLMEGIKLNLPAEFQEHFTTRLAKPDDPLLAPDEVDAVVIINTITYIDSLQPYLEKVLQGIKPGGRLYVIDYKLAAIPLPDIPAAQDRLAPDTLTSVMTSAGFDDVDVDEDLLTYQYIVTATKPLLR